MRHHRSFLTGAIAAILGLAPGATWADLTAADVWQNLNAPMVALGGTVGGTLSTVGDTTTVRDIVHQFNLPLGFGTASLATSDATLVENADGSVTLSYAMPLNIAMGFDIPSLGNGTVQFVVDGSPYALNATGTKGDVRYTYDFPQQTITIGEISIDGTAFQSQDFDIFREGSIDAQIEMAGNKGEYAILETDALITVEIEAVTSGSSYAMAFTGPNGLLTTDTGTMGEQRVQTRVALPKGGMSILALPQALRDGLAITGTSRMFDSQSSQRVEVDGQAITAQEDRVGDLQVDFAFGAAGLVFEAFGSDIWGKVLDQGILPFEIEMILENLEYGITLPLLKGDAQPFGMQIALEGVSVSDQIWAMFDPAAQLPRDGLAMRVDVTGTIGSEIDLLDAEALAALEDATTLPFTLNSLSVNELSASGVGVEADANGSFTFDMSDLTTFDGLPAPTGSVDMFLSGHNSLIDTLVSMGVIEESDAVVARLGLASFTAVGEGPDEVVSKIEIDGASRSVTANGIQIR